MAAFIKVDPATQGKWKGAYGLDGFALAGEQTSYPNYAQVNFEQATAVWAPATNAPRALQKFMAVDRIAATWYTWASLDIDIRLTDGRLHQLAMYCIDWDAQHRVQSIDVLDAATSAGLDHRALADFPGGTYLVWTIGGHVIVRIARVAGPNAVVSGLFFSPVK